MAYPVGFGNFSGAHLGSFDKVNEDDVRHVFYSLVATAQIEWNLRPENSIEAIQLGILLLIRDGREDNGGFQVISRDYQTKTLNEGNCPEIYKPLLASLKQLENFLLRVFEDKFMKMEEKVQILSELILKARDINHFSAGEKYLIDNISQLLIGIAEAVKTMKTFDDNYSRVCEFSSDNFHDINRSIAAPALVPTAPVILKDENIDEDDIRETFRTLVAQEAVRVVNEIPSEKERFHDQESEVYYGYTALALIRWTLEKDISQNGYNLHKNKIVKPSNCPPKYLELFKFVEPLYKKLATIDPKKIDYIRLKVLRSDEAESIIQKNYQFSSEDLIELNQIAGDINNIAYQVVQLDTYKDGFEVTLNKVKNQYDMDLDPKYE